MKEKGKKNILNNTSVMFGLSLLPIPPSPNTFSLLLWFCSSVLELREHSSLVPRRGQIRLPTAGDSLQPLPETAGNGSAV